MPGTHKIQDRAEKYFMLAIGKGWDEHGAYRLTSQKFGKQLADKVFSEAKGMEKQIRGNPRKFKNPNKIKIGKILDDDDGIEKMIVVEKGHPGRTNYRVFAEPTEKGKETMAYREMRAHLGDHWFSDITDSWFLPESGLSKKMQEKINKVVEEVKSEGYTRY